MNLSLRTCHFNMKDKIEDWKKRIDKVVFTVEVDKTSKQKLIILMEDISDEMGDVLNADRH